MLSIHRVSKRYYINETWDITSPILKFVDLWLVQHPQKSMVSQGAPMASLRMNMSCFSDGGWI